VSQTIWLAPSVVAVVLKKAREADDEKGTNGGTRLPDTVVRDLEAIEQVEQADRSTTVRKLLSRAIQTGSWITIRVYMAAASSPWHVLPVRRESLSGDDGLCENQENHRTI